MPKFRIAREGKTIDNREITGQQIDEMAESYNRDVYGARIWLEHFRGLFADSPFKALGDVISLSADTDDTGRKVLLAEISPTDELVKMNQDRQKIYTSIELNPNFSDTGKAYLTGLAVTDSPASTGTQALAFNVCKTHDDHLFSEFAESDMDYSDNDSEQPEGKCEKDSLLDKVKALFSRQQQTIDRQDDSIKQLFAEVEQAVTLGFTELQKELDKGNTDIAALSQQFTDLSANFDKLKAELDSTPDSDNYSERPSATGGDSMYLTDC